MPYGAVYLYLCRLELQSFFQNIYTCISVPVMYGMTVWTLPYANRQIFHQWIFIPTAAACLAARIHRWYLDDIVAVPCSFIFQHGKKLRPGNTCYGFCKFMITHHIVWFSRISIVDCFCKKSFL